MTATGDFPGGRAPHAGVDADPDTAFDPAADPGAAALGASGAEATVDVPWVRLLHQRVQRRTTGGERHRWWVLGALLAGLLALNVTFTVFVVALPQVARELHTSISVLTWTSTGPLLAFGLAAPVLGKFGDLFGHRRLYLFGLVGAMVCAVLTATAPTAGVLVAARALDGVEGAATGTASMALVLAAFPHEERVKALGWWSLVGAGGPVLGVSIGAPVISALGWRALFWGQLGLLVLSAVVVVLVLPHRRHAPNTLDTAAGEHPELAEHGEHPELAEYPDPAKEGRWRGMDWIGSWSLSAGVTSAMLVLSIGPLAGWTSGGVLAAGAVAVVALVAFVVREATAANPLIPPKYFRRRNFTLPMGTRAFLNFAYFGGFFLFPLLMEQVYGYSVSQAGLVSIARPLLFSLSAPAAGYAAVRVGERVSAVAGACCVLGSMVLFATLGVSSSLWVILAALCLSGLGMGIASPSTSSTMANEVAASEYGVMSAAQLLATQVGEVAGIQVLQTVQESSSRAAGLSTLHHDVALLASFHQAFWVGAGVAVVGILCALGMRRAPRYSNAAAALSPP